MNDEFEYTDRDGDRVRACAKRWNDGIAAWVQVRRSDGTLAAGHLSTVAARDLATKLLEWAGEPTPPAPESTCFVDLSGDMWAENPDGTYAVLTEQQEGSLVPCTPYSAGSFEYASSAYGIDPGTLDYAAAPTFKVGDRVEVEDEGPATVTHVCRAHGMPGFYVVRPDRDGDRHVVTVSGSRLMLVPPPDYPALAATFKPGDLAIVSDNPGTEAEPGSGFVEDDFNGKAVTVVSAEDDPYDEADYFGPECVRVALGNGDTNYIHVAHLTRVEAVKW